MNENNIYLIMFLMSNTGLNSIKIKWEKYSELKNNYFFIQNREYPKSYE